MKLNPVNETPRLHSVVEFVNLARSTFKLDPGQMEAFVEFMRAKGKFYMLKEQDFVPYLKHYLGQD